MEIINCRNISVKQVERRKLDLWKGKGFVGILLVSWIPTSPYSFDTLNHDPPPLLRHPVLFGDGRLEKENPTVHAKFPLT